MISGARLRPLVSDLSGELQECPPGWQAVGQSARQYQSLSSWIPLPKGAVLMHLPGRPALALNRSGGQVEAIDPHRFWAVAAVLPVGYLRLLLPAHIRSEALARTLPLYGYAAVAELGGAVVVAAASTDQFEPWTGRRPENAQLQRAVEVAQRRFSRNRVVAQLSVCALSHNCLTAQNTFLGRAEGALPTSAACNADCLGCISLQTDSGTTASQPRIARSPTAEELIEVGSYHLGAAEGAGEGGMISFGQGCEGEPLLRERTLAPVARELRRRFPRATIHINSNGSSPAALARLIRAGVNSCRISVFSFDQKIFSAYYRPRGYSIAEVQESCRVARAADCQLTVNLLTFPGVTDSLQEVGLTLERLGTLEVEQLQLRSLNVDPLWLLERIPEVSAGIGLEVFLERLRAELPQLLLGNFTRPREAHAGAPAAAAG